MNRKLAKMKNEHPIGYKCEVNPIGETAKVYLYGDVTDDEEYDFWTGEKIEGISPKGVRDIFENIESDNIDVHINSYGGSAIAGLAIKNYLEGLNKNLTFYIDGIGASAASYIPMAGKVRMYKNSLLMIHRAWGYAIGNKNDFQKEVNALEKLDKAIMSNYESRFKGDNLEELLDNETWLTAEEALECGLCDEIVEYPKEEIVEEEVPEEPKYNKSNKKLEALLSASFNFIKNKGDIR